MYEAYTKELTKLEEMLNHISTQEYSQARQMGEELYQEIIDTWNHHLSKKFKEHYCKEFSQAVVRQTINSLKLYFADKNLDALDRNLTELKRKLKDFRNSDVEIIHNPQSAQVIAHRTPEKKQKPKEKPKARPTVPEPEPESVPEIMPEISSALPTVKEQYFMKTKFSIRMKHFFHDKHQQESLLNQKIRMIIMIESSQPQDADAYYKAFLFNAYQFERKEHFFQKAVYYEHVYKPDELEFAFDVPPTDAVRKKMHHIFDAGTGGTTNDYGFFIRLYENTLHVELKRKGDIVSLNAADNPYMVNAKHRIEILPQSSTDTELKFEQQIYFDTNSGHQNTETGNTGTKGADVKFTFLLSLLR